MKSMSLNFKWYGFGQDVTLDEAIRALHRGDVEEAAALLRVVLAEKKVSNFLDIAQRYLLESLIRSAEKADERGQFDDSREMLREACELEPMYPDLRLRYAKACRAVGDTFEEREAVDAALRIKPEFPKALVYLGYMETRFGRCGAAGRFVREAIELLPRTDDVLEDALAHCQSNSADKALHLLERWLTTSKEDVSRFLLEADHLSASRNFEGASRSLETALTIAPKYADVRCRYGQVLLELDRVDEAKAQFDLALEINPKYVEARAQLGIALKRLGMDAQALEEFRQVLELNPHHPIAVHETTRRENH